MPDYSFIEPNYTDHDTDRGEELANDQHPDHNVQAGELFIAQVYMAIKRNPALWASTAILVVYDEHGGIYDHVVPPACPPDQFTATANDTGTGREFKFDRLGVRVPAVLISPWIPKDTVVDRIFDHASIPGTVTKFFLGEYDPRSPREKNADVFIEPKTQARRFKQETCFPSRRCERLSGIQCLEQRGRSLDDDDSRPAGRRRPHSM